MLLSTSARDGKKNGKEKEILKLISDFRSPRKENSQFLAGGFKGERHAACKICKVDFSVTLTSVSIMSPATREANYSFLSLKKSVALYSIFCYCHSL